MYGKGGIDAAIAELARRQGGAISRKQLMALGCNRAAIDYRVRIGRLHVIHRGVYAVGHVVLGIEGRRWAAVLACEPGAALSHAAAAAALGFRRSSASVLDVTVVGTGRKPQAGIRMHRRRAVAADEITTLDGLPITTPARTLLDLAASGVRGRPLGTALDRADQSGILDFTDLAILLDRYAGRPGTPALREALGKYAGGDARSELEEIIAELCADHGIPRPQENVAVLGQVRDFYWPRARLVVEADSYAWHRSPDAMADDRQRDVELTLAGIRTLRFTWSQATRRRAYVVSALRSAFA
ncbi:MAG: type IV toxin-antitoxin system AbiEi family antitoxin domain-containing protein [Solirubrobacteraceae bacterium]